MNRDRALLAVVMCCLFSPSFTFGAAVKSQSPTGLVDDAIRQMGGEQQLRALHAVHFEAVSYRNALEQSERPEGPYIVEYDRISESRDFEHGSWKQQQEMNWVIQAPVKSTVIVANGAAAQVFGSQVGPGGGQQLQDAEEALDLGPERILLIASAAPDLRTEPETVVQAVAHHVVAFTWKGLTVRIFLNTDTALPTAVEWKRAYPYNMYWSPWGDVTTRVYYSFWWLLPGGIHYPRQWDTFRNGLPDREVTISEITLNPTFPADEFAIPQDVRSKYLANPGRTVEDHSVGLPDQPVLEIVKDVVHIPGAWNVTLVRQSNGIIVIEAPISSGYSAKVIAEVERRWPGVRIKGVISTSDAWPHIGGVREYVARGIPVYALDVNLPILQRLIDSPRTFFPDQLARTNRKPIFHIVTGKMVIGDGSNRLEIYPLRGETSERQMMVYLPGQKLLYGSDAFQKDETGAYFYPQTVWEVKHAVERENLQVRTFFMMHMGPTDWGDLDKTGVQVEHPTAVVQ